MKKNFIISSSLFIFSITLISTYSSLKAQTTTAKIESGEVIAYCFQPMEQGIHEIYVIDEGGDNNMKLINATIGLNHPDISADGQRVVCVGYVPTGSIHVFNIDGTGLTRLTNTSNVTDYQPAWSPDGTQIAFTRIYGSWVKVELWIMNSDGSNQHYIGVEGSAAKWSTDGNSLIYSSKVSGNYDIYTCDTDGSNVQRLTTTVLNETNPAYSPDGAQIAYCGFTDENNSSTYEIYKMNSDGTNNSKLTNNNFMDSNPRWSPDGTRFVFGSDRHEVNKWEVYIMNVDGSNVHRVTNSPSGITAINPVWMPLDSSTFVNEVSLPLENFQLYQNHPNPFNPTTIIPYQVPQLSFVTIKVYDVLGSEIATLVNEEKSAGNYKVNFNGSNAPSGVYFYRIQSGEFIKTKKMVLLK